MTTVVDPKTAPPSVFPAHDGAVYEQAMGRWSRRLAPLLIEFGGLADGDRVLDVGCGTGSLSYALPEAANVAAVTGSTRPRCTSRMRACAALTRASFPARGCAGTAVCRWLVRPRLFDARTDVYPRCGACRR